MTSAMSASKILVRYSSRLRVPGPSLLHHSRAEQIQTVKFKVAAFRVYSMRVLHVTTQGIGGSYEYAIRKQGAFRRHSFARGHNFIQQSVAADSYPLRVQFLS
jgi:hypothetical protein